MNDLFGNSSLQDTGERSAFDWYPTPAFMTRSLLYHVPEIAGCSVLEPASGDDAIVDVLRDEFGCRVLTNDIDLAHPSKFHFDAREESIWAESLAYDHGNGVQWVITNPPFNCAFPMLKLAIQYARVGVAFLLRKTFLEPTEERGEWLHTFPPSRIICQPRYSFRGDGNDSVSCDWLIYERQPNRAAYPIEIDHLAKTRTSKGATA